MAESYMLSESIQSEKATHCVNSTVYLSVNGRALETVKGLVVAKGSGGDQDESVGNRGFLEH